MAINAAAAVAAPAVAPWLTGPVASVIQTGTSLLSGIFGGGGGAARRRAEAREDSQMQRRTADARAAGLHPLFALGAGGVGGPSTLIGQSASGSKLGDAIQTAGRGVAHYANARVDPLSAKMAQLQIQNAEVNLRKNLIDEQLMNSELATTLSAAASQGRDQEYTLRPEIRDVRRRVGAKEKVTTIADNQPIRIRMPGGQYLIVDRSTDAQDMEDLFGDPVSWGYGLWKLAASIDATMGEGRKPLAPELAAAHRRMLKMFGNRWKNIINSYDRNRKSKGFKSMVDRTKTTRKRLKF